MKLLSHYIEPRADRALKIENWTNYVLFDRLSYSSRETEYDAATYPSDLHSHDYYELVVYEAGDIRYICDGGSFRLERGDVIIIPPTSFHMSIINCQRTVYKRQVFYLYPSVFDAMGAPTLSELLKSSDRPTVLSLEDHAQRERLLSLLGELSVLVGKDTAPLDAALALSRIIEIFWLLNSGGRAEKDRISDLPKSIVDIIGYIETRYAEISSISEIAEHFYYSREHLSRLFTKHFDTSVSDYLMKLRVEKSKALLLEGRSVTEVAYAVGFGSHSAFVRSFSRVTDMTPTEYRRLRRRIQ